MTSQKLRLNIVLLALLLLAFALRLHQLTMQSLWWDEGISLNLARLSIAEIALDRVNNIHPPLYFVLLKFWTTLTGLNTFSARYLSVLASFGQVAFTFAVCRRWFKSTITPHPAPRSLNRDHRLPIPGAWVALVLIAISPLSIIYGQEVRVYAILPLLSLMLLALAWQIREIKAPSFKKVEPLLVYLGVVEWIGIHLHYVVVFVIVYIGLWLLLVLVGEKRWRALKQFIIVQLIVGVASLPWFTAVIQNWTAVQAEANAGTYLTDPVPLDFLLKQVWVFHHTGLAGSLARMDVWWLALGLLLGTGVLLLWRIWQKQTRSTAVRLLLQWLVPLAGALIVWSVRSFSHPRYISFTAVGFIILVAYLIYPKLERRVSRLILPGMLLAALVSLSLLGLSLYFSKDQFNKDDMRGVAQLLEEMSTADDLIIIPDTDWSLPFEYQGDAHIVMPGLPDREMMWLNFVAETAVPRRVFTVRYAQGNRDWQKVVPFALEAAGTPRQSWQIDDLTVTAYQLYQPVDQPTIEPLTAQFGPVQLTAVWLEPEVALNTAVTTALQWQTNETDERYQVKMRLLDPDGFVLAETSDLLLAEDGRPTNLWPADQLVTTYHLIPLPPGTAAVPAQLEITVFYEGEEGLHTENLADGSGQQLVAGQTQLVFDDRVTESIYELSNPVPNLANAKTFEDGLNLVGFVAEQNQLNPGQSLFVHLQWLAERPLPPITPELKLLHNGVEIAAADSSQALAQHVPAQWPPGQLVNDHRHVRIPAEASGTAVLVLQVGDEVVALSEIEISGQTRQMSRPSISYETDVIFGDVARLVGYDLPAGPFPTTEPIPLTLYWQSLRSGIETEYTVFAHLLAADGRLLGQHDSVPNNGQNPTTGWLTDEFITDNHEILLAPENDNYSGAARLAVGLYDPQTAVRLTLPDGTDSFVLPLEIEIED